MKRISFHDSTEALLFGSASRRLKEERSAIDALFPYEFREDVTRVAHTIYNGRLSRWLEACYAFMELWTKRRVPADIRYAMNEAEDVLGKHVTYFGPDAGSVGDEVSVVGQRHEH